MSDTKKFTTIQLYTQTAVDIINAAIYNWSGSHNRTWLAHNTIALLDNATSPDGSMVIFNTDYYRRRLIKPEMVAWAIKDLLYNACVYKNPDNLPLKDLQDYKTPIYNRNENGNAEMYAKMRDKEQNVKVIMVAYNRGDNAWDHRPCRNGKKMVEFNTQDAWIIYDYLLGHRKSTMEKKFGIERIASVIGAPRDPMMVEQTKLFNDQIAEIEAKATEDCQKLENEQYAEISKIRKLYETKIAERKALKEQEKWKLTEEFNKIQEAAALMIAAAGM